MPFTAETARIAAKLSLAAKMEAKLRPKEPVQHVEAAFTALVPACPPDDFTIRKLARIREQIDRVEQLLDNADEPQAVDRFANALTRLYDLERILAGRPLPGSRRPAPDSKRNAAPTQIAPWLPAEEHPAQPAPVAPAALPPVPQVAAPAVPAPAPAPEVPPIQPTDTLPGNVTP